MLVIDGSQGEGGGQVLRTALSLAMVTRQPMRLERIRGGRPTPGLRAQHLTAVRAAAQICQAKLEGASLGSQSLTFEPGAVQPGAYEFTTGTAGSTSLILQTLLPALMLASKPSTLLLEGGTHNPLAPPFEFLEKVFLPVINQMGPTVRARLERHGFYPAGGGSLQVSIAPAAKLEPLELLERGPVQGQFARVLIAQLPRAIAERELSVVRSKLKLPATAARVQEVTDSRGPGNAVLVEVRSFWITELFCAFGQPGIRAEMVAAQAAQQTLDYLAANVPVGPHLADQLLLPMALAGAGAFATNRLSSHALTHRELISRFLPVKFEVESTSERTCCVRVGPNTGFLA